MGDTALLDIIESLPISDLEKSLKPARSADIETFKREIKKALKDQNITFDKFSEYMETTYSFSQIQKKDGQVFDYYLEAVALIHQREYSHDH